MRTFIGKFFQFFGFFYMLLAPIVTPIAMYQGGIDWKIIIAATLGAIVYGYILMKIGDLFVAWGERSSEFFDFDDYLPWLLLIGSIACVAIGVYAYIEGTYIAVGGAITFGTPLIGHCIKKFKERYFD